MVAGLLRLQDGEPIVALHRLRLADDRPLGIQRVRRPAGRFPGLEHADLTDRSRYEHLRTTYGVIPTVAEETFRVGQIGAGEARLLPPPDRPETDVVQRAGTGRSP